MDILSWIDEPDSNSGIYLGRECQNWDYISYSELAAEIGRYTTILNNAARLPAGAVVVLLISEPRDFICAFYAVLLAGCTPSPVATPITFADTDAYRAHVSRLVAAARPALVVVDGAHRADMNEAMAISGCGATIVTYDRPGHDVPISAKRGTARHALLQFTSGSSGTPKGVDVTRDNLNANVTANIDQIAGDDAQTAVSWLPLYHDMGLIGMMLTPVAAGHRLRLMTPGQFLHSPRRWLDALDDELPTYTAAPSFGYGYAARRIAALDNAPDLSRWRVAILAAERIDPAAVRSFLELTERHGFAADRFASAYGLAEATLTVTSTRASEPISMVRPGAATIRRDTPVQIAERARLGAPETIRGGWIASCGRAIGGMSVEICDDDGRTLPAGHPGQIRVHGPSVTDGYRDHPSVGGHTAFSSGGMNTADTGFILDGELYVIGRTGDSIKLHGSSLYAEDLEARLRAHIPRVAGRMAVVLGTSPTGCSIAVIIESSSARWGAEWVDTIVAATRSTPAPLLILRGDRGTIARTSSGKPRRRLMWQHILDCSLAVEIKYTTWPKSIWPVSANHPSRQQESQ